jgi:hypothetical protein
MQSATVGELGGTGKIEVADVTFESRARPVGIERW